MSVLLYRIDDRLVHGQVMTAWTKIYNTTRIFVVDDQTAANQFLCDVMKMAVPSNYEIYIYTKQDAVAAIKNDPASKKTIVLAKDPQSMLYLLEQGVEMTELNVGNIGAGKGRKPLMRSTQVTPEEHQQLKAIQSKGVRVYLQIYPDGKTMELDKCKY